MAYYVVEYSFTADRRHLGARTEHRAYLAGLVKEGRLALAGSLDSDTGGLLVYRAGTEAEVRELVAHDPFSLANALSQVRIRPWNPILGYLVDAL